MSGLEKEVEEQAKKGRSQGVKGHPPASALGPDTNEVAILARIQKQFIQQKEPILLQLSQAEKRVSAVELDLAQLRASADNAADTANIQSATGSALAEQRNSLIQDVKRKKYARSLLLQFMGDRGIHREARYDHSVWALLQWMVIIFAIELLLNTYFYSLNVGLASGAFIAATLAFITASFGFVIGSLFRLTREQDVFKRSIGWIATLVGVFLTIYLASLTATYRSLTVVVREQYIHSATGLIYVPAYQLFGEAFAKAPQIFLFPITLRIPFQDLSSFLLFLISLLTFFVAFWKGDTAHDRIWGYMEIDKASKAAEATVHSHERKLIEIAKNASNACVAERNKIVQGFTSSGSILTSSKADVERLQTQLQHCADGHRRDFGLLITAYRTGVAEVHPSALPTYFRQEPVIDLDLSQHVFKALTEKISEQKTNLEALMALSLDHLKAEIADATKQGKLANESVADFMAACEVEADREIREERRSGTYAGAAGATLA